jgi:hypothetical protein
VRKNDINNPENMDEGVSMCIDMKRSKATCITGKYNDARSKNSL